MELINPALREQQQCESCKKDFHCGASLTGCWCQRITISQETRNDLRRQYKECLCEECLMFFEKGRRANVKAE